MYNINKQNYLIFFTLICLFFSFSEQQYFQKGNAERRMTDPRQKQFSGASKKLQFIKVLEEIVIHVIGDSGLVRYMISKFTEEIIKVTICSPMRVKLILEIVCYH